MDRVHFNFMLKLLYKLFNIFHFITASDDSFSFDLSFTYTLIPLRFDMNENCTVYKKRLTNNFLMMMKIFNILFFIYRVNVSLPHKSAQKTSRHFRIFIAFLLCRSPPTPLVSFIITRTRHVKDII